MNLKKENFCFVYIRKIEDYKDNNILPSFIVDNLKTITNQNVINQKKSSYGVLHEAVKNVFGFVDDFSFVEKNSNGKPLSPNYYFSISHSCGFVAVALSNKNVGIDIEKIDEKRNLENLRKIVLHKNENISSIEDLIKLWTKKEAKFKFDGEKVFVPSKIDSTSFDSTTKLIKKDNCSFLISIVSSVNNIKFLW